MQSLQVFRTLSEAIKAGYEVYDLTSDGYVLRKLTPQGWTMALAELHRSA